MDHYWGAGSGKYIGYRKGDNLHNSSGHHIGIFKGDYVHSSKTGRRVAKIRNTKYLDSSSGGATIGIYSAGNAGSRSMADRGGIGGSDPSF